MEITRARISLLFALIAATIGIFVFEIAFWSAGPYIDDTLWATSAAQFAIHIPPTTLDDMSVHPGTTVLVPAGLLIRFGFPKNVALNIVLAFAVTIGTCIVGLQCYFLRPRSIWWFAAILLLTCNTLYLTLTPPSVVATFLVLTWLLLILRIVENPEKNGAEPAYLGICAAFLLATRLDTGVLIIAISSPYVVYLLRKRSSIVLSVALLLFPFLDPYLWVEPGAHIAKILQVIHGNSVFADNTAWNMYAAIPMVISFIVCAGIALFSGSKITLSRSYFLFLFFLTAFTTIIFTSAHYHPLRYYFVIFAIWEILAPLMVFEWLSSKESVPQETNRAFSWQQFSVIALLLADRLIPFFFMGGPPDHIV